jgi:class I fructose-bisphosphate aldolase
MDSRTGKKIRMGRIFNGMSGKTLILAYSHGVVLGPEPGMASLDEIRKVAAQLGEADALLVSPGMVGHLEESFIGRGKPGFMVHLDYQSFSRTVLPYPVGSTTSLAEVEDLAATGADGLMTYLYVGYEDPEREKEEIARNARLARACERWGIVLMIEALSARSKTNPEDVTDARLLAMCCRIASDIGADIVKCQYPGSAEAIATVASGCLSPLVLAGGAKTADPEEPFRMAREAIGAGAAGLVYGRNIFGARDPRAAIRRYREIIHGTWA